MWKGVVFLTEVVFDLQRDTAHLQILHNVLLCVFCIVSIKVDCMGGREFGKETIGSSFLMRREVWSCFRENECVGSGRQLALFYRKSYNHSLYLFWVTVALERDGGGATRSTGTGNGTYKEVLQQKSGLVDLGQV